MDRVDGAAVRAPAPGVCRCDTIGLRCGVPWRSCCWLARWSLKATSSGCIPDAPRLLLTPQRLRLLQRERERDSLRWQPFSTLVAGGAAMPEPGFAWGLYYRASGQAAWGKKAVDWALGDEAKDLRQLALVFDWCGPVMTDAQAERLAAKLQKALMAVGWRRCATAECARLRGDRAGGPLAGSWRVRAEAA